MTTIPYRSRFGQVFLPPPLLSARARWLGLETLADVEREYAEGKRQWGCKRVDACWHCPLCDLDFASVNGAREHMAAWAHRVLRWDWYDWLPPALRCVRPGRAPAAPTAPSATRALLDGAPSPAPPRRRGVPPALPAAGSATYRHNTQTTEGSA